MATRMVTGATNQTSVVENTEERDQSWSRSFAFLRPAFLSKQLTRLDVPCPQRSKIANVERPIRNHRICKRSFRKRSNLFLLRLRGRREASLFAITVRSRFNQRNVAVDSVQVQVTIGSGDRRPADCLSLPLHFPGRKLSRNQLLPGLSSIDMIADDHRTADTVRQPACEVNLLRYNPAAIRFQSHHRTTDT